MTAETPADRARRLLEGATPGPWWPSQHNGPNDVDRGKIWGFRAGPPPVQAIVVGEVNRFIGTAADQKIMAAAPDLARDFIAETEAHEVTRAALAAVERERDEARAELAAAWEETGRPSGCNTLAGAVRWAFRGRYNRGEMSQILGRREGETTAEAARRVVAELEGARAALGLAVADRDRTARVLSIRHEEIAQARAEVERQVSHGDAAQMGRDLDTASVPQLPTLLERVEAACTIIVGLRRHAADVDPLERERDEARAELAAAQDRLTWPRWMEAWDGSFGLVPSDGGPYLAIVCPEDGMWRPWSGIGCNDQRSPGSFDEAEAYLVDLGHIRAGCTIRPCAGGAR